MMALYAALALSLSLGGLLLALYRHSYKRGEKDAENKTMKGILDDVYVAKRAKEIVNSRPNSDAAKRVRRKYTRDS